MTLTMLHLLLCAALLWSCFCRSARMSKGNTLRSVRWAFQGLTVAAATGLAAPFLWGYRPEWVAVLMVAGITWVQLVTARHWHHGVPAPFQRSQCPPGGQMEG